MKLRTGLLLAAFLVAGCGGGGGGSTPGGALPGNPGSTTPQYGKLTLTFPYTAPPATGSGARPQYVSPNAASVEVIVNTVNGGAPPSWVPADTTTNLTFTGGSPTCTVSGGTATCSVQVAAPPGTVNYTFNIFDASSNKLATLTTNETIVQGTNNTISITLGGVPKTVNISLPALTANTSVSGGTVTWSALDASGAQIVGSAPFANAITITDNDTTGQTSLQVNGGATATSVTLTKPTDALTINYTGQATNPFSLSASGTGITGSGSVVPTVFDVTFTGTTLDDAAHGGLNTDANWSEPTLFFSQASGSQNVTGAEVGFTNASFNQQFDLDQGPAVGSWCTNKPGIATFSAGPATTFTITAAGTPGICEVRLKEHGTGYPITTHPAPSSATDTTHDGVFWISVTTSSFTVNGHNHH